MGDKDEGTKAQIDDQLLEISLEVRDAASPPVSILKELREEIRREEEKPERRDVYKSKLKEIDERLKRLQKKFDKGAQERRDRKLARKLAIAKSRRLCVLQEEEKDIDKASSDESFFAEVDEEIRQEEEKEEREKEFQ